MAHLPGPQNGKRSDHYYAFGIAGEINRLRAAGFTVKEIRIEGAPPLNPPYRVASRKSFSERFGGFDPEAGDDD